jgi:hypothetical protein
MASSSNLPLDNSTNIASKLARLKRPTQEAVTACGWIYEAVAFGTL